MSDSIPPLGDDLAASIARLREIEPAPAEVRARARSRLFAAVGAVPPVGGRSSLATARVAAVAFVAGGIAGAGLYAALAPRPAPHVVYVDRTSPPVVQPMAPATAPAPSALPAAPTALAPTPASPAAPPSSSPASRASQLSAERVLLDEARAALAQGDPARAEERLERHRRTFPTPILGEERDAMRVEALVKQARYDDARAAAASFRKRWPDSLFGSAVDAAIDSIP